MPNNSKKLHILSVVSQLTGGGAERNLVRISGLLARKGVKVDLLVLRDSDKEDIKPDLGVNVHHLGLTRDLPMPRHLVETVKNILLLRKMFVMLRPDKVLSFCCRTNILCLEAALGTGIPVVVSERNNPMREDERLVNQFRRQIWYPKAYKVVLLAEELEGWAGKMYPRWRYCAIPNFIPAPPDMETVERPSSRRMILGVGRLVRQKGFDRLIESFALLKEDFPGWDLTVVGDGPEMQMLKEMVGRCGLNGRVFFAGWSADVYAFYSSADVFAFPSRYEGFGMTLAEALSCGLPAVAFDCPYGPSRIVQNGVNGFLVTEGRTDLFSEKLGELMTSEARRKRMGESAREVIRRFGVEPILSQWESVLLEG